MLLDLEDANAFVFSVDPERTWFRYHQLFGELLRWSCGEPRQAKSKPAQIGSALVCRSRRAD